MKHLVFCVTILLCSIVAQGQSSDDEIFKYKVLSITECIFSNGEVIEGETTFPKDNRTIYVDEEEVSVVIEKTNTKITFDIKDFNFDEGILVYETTHRLSKDKVAILVKRYDNGIYTFSFINFNEENCYIYRVEYLGGKGRGYSVEGNANDVVRPKYYSSEELYTKIDNVTVTDSYTIVEMSWFNNEYIDGWVNIDKAAVIVAQGMKYALIKTENIPYAPEKTEVGYGQTIKFKLYFQPIPKNTVSFDLIENESSEWKFYDIEL